MDFKLIVKKINNNLTPEEEREFDQWYKESKNHRDYFNKVEENYASTHYHIDEERAWEITSAKINFKTRKINNIKYSIAATIAILVGTFLIIKYNQPIETRVNPIASNKEDINIGVDKAILELADGSQVVLKKGSEYVTNQIKSDGEKVEYTATAKSSTTSYNVLTVPRGGQFFVILSDGTRVTLNSDSKLRYPVYFDDKKARRVELVYGEAYFEVSPSTEHNGTHFILDTQNQEINVIGTKFNVKAYKEEENITTTLVEGKVLVNSEETSVNLTPGNKSILNTKTNQIKVTPAEIYNEISWTKGFFSFKKKSIKDIMTVLARWYDIDFVFENEDIQNISFNGVFSKKQNLNEILEIIENTDELKFTIDGKKILIMKNI